MIKNICRYQNLIKKSFWGLLCWNIDSYFCLPERCLQHNFATILSLTSSQPFDHLGLKDLSNDTQKVQVKDKPLIHTWTIRIDRTCGSDRWGLESQTRFSGRDSLLNSVCYWQGMESITRASSTSTREEKTDYLSITWFLVLLLALLSHCWLNLTHRWTSQNQCIFFKQNALIFHFYYNSQFVWQVSIGDNRIIFKIWINIILSNICIEKHIQFHKWQAQASLTEQRSAVTDSC